MIEYLVTFLLCAVIGVLSALLGLGGGILLVPLFTLFLDLPIREAIALSLCCVIATSVSSADRYLADGLVDVKAALHLELTAVVGAYLSGLAAGYINETVISVLFAVTLILVTLFTLLKRDPTVETPGKRRFAIGMGASVFAGGLVGLLGIGGGILKMPILQLCLNKSLKQAVAASALMIGISSVVAILPYLARGDVPLSWVPFAALGAMVGAYIGARSLARIRSLYVRLLFAAALIYTAISMIRKAFAE